MDKREPLCPMPSGGTASPLAELAKHCAVELMMNSIGEPQGPPYEWVSFPYTFQRMEEITAHYRKSLIQLLSTSVVD